MTKYYYSIIVPLLLFISVQGQSKKDTSAYFNQIKNIVATENIGNNLIYRLDTLKSKLIASRSPISDLLNYIDDYFNRDIDFGFKHRRIKVSINSANYQIDLLCYKDTIFLSSITSYHYKNSNYHNYNKEITDQFLKKRNKLYVSSKTAAQLIKDISLNEQYAFYCGEGMLKTQKGKHIEQLVEDEDVETLTYMLKSVNCEIQAYGVAGLEMLDKREYHISKEIQKLIDYIKERNSELIVCNGCFPGLVDKIYSKR